MAQIAIDFLYGTDFSSKLIGWFGQGGNGYSHVASVLSDGRYLDSRSDEIAGVPAGVHIRHAETETWLRKRRAILPVTDAEYASWEANLRAKIGDQYALWDIVQFLDPNECHEDGKYICSALAINAVQHLSRSWEPGHLGYIPYPLSIPAHQITPNAALLIVQTAGFSLGPVEYAS